MSEKSRVDLLKDLVEGRMSPSDAEKALSAYPFDSEPLVVIGAKDISRILERMIAGEVTPDYLEEWTNVIEVRDDLWADQACAEKINSVVHELANPLLAGPLDKRSARTMLEIAEMLKLACSRR